MAKPADDIKEIFARYSENGIMTIDHLHRFLIEHQKESNATKEDAQQIFNSLKQRNVFRRRGLSLDAFFRYLLSDLNTPLPSEVHHDMDAPLSHYFIYTSCINLTGNQLSRAASSIDTIVKALRRGVRVIELDLWPTFNELGVEAFHEMMTLTSPVDLNECLRAIKDNAFIAFEYPVIINFQDQLIDPDHQDQIAQMVTKTFGDMLYYPDYSDIFPSPNSLKRRVLISITKLQKAELNNGELIVEEKDEEKAVPEYRKLIAIHTIKLKGGSNLWPTLLDSKVKRLSISHEQLPNWLEETCDENILNWIRFTQSNILSVYPNDLCVGSSNYDPYWWWLYGAQMVTLNMQQTGKNLWIVQGMFRANGGCGYVKKPFFLLEDPLTYIYQLPPSRALKIKIYHGEGWHLDFSRTAFDRYSPPNFFVKIRINGAPIDEKKGETKPVMNQWVPNWNEEFEFNVYWPELAVPVLRIKVLEYNKTRKLDFIAQTSFPVTELKNGIRAVPLYNKNGDEYKHTRLLMRFEF